MENAERDVVTGRNGAMPVAGDGSEQWSACAVAGGSVTS